LKSNGRPQSWFQSAQCRKTVGRATDLEDFPSLLVYPTDPAAYGRLCRLLTIGKARAGKGKCSLFLDDVVAWSEGLIAILVTDKPSGELPQQLKRICILVEAVTDYAIYMLDPKGIVSSWNPGARRFKGYEPAEIIGKHFSNFYTDEDKAAGIPQRALKQPSGRESSRAKAGGPARMMASSGPMSLSIRT
jgi:PAS domain-containing protein